VGGGCVGGMLGKGMAMGKGGGRRGGRKGRSEKEEKKDRGNVRGWVWRERKIRSGGDVAEDERAEKRKGGEKRAVLGCRVHPDGRTLG